MDEFHQEDSKMKSSFHMAGMQILCINSPVSRGGCGVLDKPWAPRFTVQKVRILDRRSLWLAAL
jgi:hypothetical protein